MSVSIFLLAHGNHVSTLGGDVLEIFLPIRTPRRCYVANPSAELTAFPFLNLLLHIPDILVSQLPPSAYPE